MGLDVYTVREKYYDKPGPYVRSFLTWFVGAQLGLEKVSGITNFYFFGDESDFFVKLKWKEVQVDVKSYIIDHGISEEASAEINSWINSLPWVRGTIDEEGTKDYYITLHLNF